MNRYPSASIRSKTTPQRLNLPTIVNFLFELDQQSLVDRSGWLRLGKKVEQNASHVLRVAQIGYILALAEKHPNPGEVVSACVFHEIDEARTGDANAIAKRYIKIDDTRAVRDATLPLGKTGEEIFKLWMLVKEKSTLTGQIAKDADYLEMALRARQLQCEGKKDARVFYVDESTLYTKSARALMRRIKRSDPNRWWKTI